MTSKKRKRQRPPESEDDRRMRALIAMGRGMKRDRIDNEGDERNLMPSVSLFRGDEHVGIVGLWGDVDYAMASLRMAVGGFDADEVHLLHDSYCISYVSGDQPLHDDLERMFNSPDPVQRSVVGEALWAYRARRKPDRSGIDEWSCFAPYTYDPKSHRYRWGALRHDSPGDPVVRANVARGLLKRGFGDFVGALTNEVTRFELDAAVVYCLLGRGASVALLLTPEQEVQLSERLQGTHHEVQSI